MGNEKQIDYELIERSKSEFLPAEFQDPEGAVEIYSLEEEYAKTQKNKNFILYSIVGVFLILVVAASVSYTTWIQLKGKQITIDISDFEDVKLLELINKSKQIEAKIARLKHELFELRREYDDAIQRIKDEFSSQKDVVLAKEMSEEEILAESGQVSGKFKSQISYTRSKYKSQINAKEKEIRELELELVAIKQNLDAKGQIARTALSSRDELYSLQMDSMREQYEKKIEEINRKHEKEVDSLILKFNPHFKNQQLKKLIAGYIKTYELPDQLLANIEDDLKKEGITDATTIEAIRESVSNQIALLDRLEKVPYQNSIPRSLFHAESMAKSTATKYDKIVQNLVTSIRHKNTMLSHYSYALDEALKKEGEAGYVLDTRKKNKISVYIDSTYNVKNGATAYVFRNDDQQIATVTITKEGKRLYAKPVGQSAEEIKPFDKLMLKVK